jgi:hypothetical protein
MLIILKYFRFIAIRLAGTSINHFLKLVAFAILTQFHWVCIYGVSR